MIVWQRCIEIGEGIMRKRNLFKKGMALLLAVVMVVTLMPNIGESMTVQAATVNADNAIISIYDSATGNTTYYNNDNAHYLSEAFSSDISSNVTITFYQDISDEGLMGIAEYMRMMRLHLIDGASLVYDLNNHSVSCLNADVGYGNSSANASVTVKNGTTAGVGINTDCSTVNLNLENLNINGQLYLCGHWINTKNINISGDVTVDFNNTSDGTGTFFAGGYSDKTVITGDENSHFKVIGDTTLQDTATNEEQYDEQGIEIQSGNVELGIIRLSHLESGATQEKSKNTVLSIGENAIVSASSIKNLNVDNKGMLTLTGENVLESGKTFTNSGILNVIGSIVNKGTINNNANGVIKVSNEDSIIDNGTFNNNGTVYSSVTLNLSNGAIDITPEGYTQNGVTNSYTGEYIITGTMSGDTPLDFSNNTGQAAAFNVTFKDAHVLAATNCTAIRFENSNADINVNITNEGTSEVFAWNHPAFQQLQSCSANVTVKITNSDNSNLSIGRRDGTNCETIYTDNNYKKINLTIDGQVPDNTTKYGGNITWVEEGTKEELTPVFYIDETGRSASCSDYTVVSDTTGLGDGGSYSWGTSGETSWYVVKDDVYIRNIIFLYGNINLILCDGAKLTANESIIVNLNNSLTIYSQELGTGTLIANGGNIGAAIGSWVSNQAGEITIHGGNIKAKSVGNHSAAIGGGDANNTNSQSNQSDKEIFVTITGGKITASCDEDGVNAIGNGRGGNKIVVNTAGMKVTSGSIDGTSVTLEVCTEHSNEEAYLSSENIISYRCASCKKKLEKKDNVLSISKTDEAFLHGKSNNNLTANLTNTSSSVGYQWLKKEKAKFNTSYSIEVQNGFNKLEDGKYISTPDMGDSWIGANYSDIKSGGKICFDISGDNTHGRYSLQRIDAVMPVKYGEINRSGIYEFDNLEHASYRLVIIMTTNPVTVDFEPAIDVYKEIEGATNPTYTIPTDTPVGNYQYAVTATYQGITATKEIDVAIVEPSIPVNITSTDVTMKYSAGLKVDVSNYFRVDANAGERSYSVVEGPETNGCLNGSILTVNKTGRYKIKLSTLSNGHYCAGEAYVWITIEKGIIQSSAAGYTGTYDQTAHGITVTVTNPTDATVSYSTDGNNYSTQNPRFTDVGVYNVLYKIERENYETVTGNATVTINAAQQDDAGQNNDVNPGNTEEPGQNNEPIPSDIVLDEEVEEADEPEAAEEEEEFDEEDIEENSDNLDKLAKATWSKNKFKVSWDKVDTATGYDIFAVSCGKKITNKSLVKTVRGYKNISATITKIEGKNVSTKKNYKVQIKAFKIKNGVKEYIGNSMQYSVAGTSNTTYTNAKSVKVTSKSITLKKGKTTQIKAEIVKLSKKKKLFPKKYGSALRYKSTNSDVATVNSSGKVKAKKKGTCYIYVIALNGVKTAIKITVK